MLTIGEALRRALGVSETGSHGLAFPRGSVVEIPQGGRRRFAIVLSNEEVRRKRPYKAPLIVVVYLVEVAEADAVVGARITFDSDTGIRHCEAVPWTVRTIDSTSTPPHVVRTVDRQPVVVPPAMVESAAGVILAFLEVQ